MSCTNNGTHNDFQALSSDENFKFEYNLIEVERFGKVANDADSNSVNQIFGRISDFLVTNNDELYVLDAFFKKVYKIANDTLITFGDGYGRGPNEFLLPLAVTMYDDQLWIYDYELQRFNVYKDTSYVTSLPAPFATKSVVIADSIIWATNLSSTFYYLSKLDINTDKKSNYLKITERDLAFSPNGFLGYLTKDEDAIYMNYERPGIWLEFKNGEYTQKGEELFPELNANKVDNTWIMPVQATGFDIVSDSLLLISWTKKNNPKVKGSGIEATYIEVFNKKGKRLGRAKFNKPFLGSFKAHPTKNYVYISVEEEYPQIIKYELVKN